MKVNSATATSVHEAAKKRRALKITKIAIWIICVLITLAKTIYLSYSYAVMKHMIYVHFDMNGNPTGNQTTKTMLIGMLLLDISTIFTLWVCTKIPHYLIPGLANLSGARRKNMMTNIYLIVSILALVCAVVTTWAEYFVISHN